ncbi:MAG: hypothetical protein R2725_07535 [Solirubrobacterales bacterium]
MSLMEQTERRQELDRRIQEFHGVDLERVIEVISYLRDEGDSALVGGSLAYGLGNATSDLDIVVAGPQTIDSSSRMPLEHFIETLRVDVWRMMQSEIDELFVRAEAALASEAPFAGAFGDVVEQADLKLLHRLAYGFVIDGEPLRPNGVRDYNEIARDILVREYAERLRESALISRLASAAGHSLAAAMNARYALEQALMATSAARGVPFSDNKWLRVHLDQDVPDLKPIYQPFAELPEGEVELREFALAALAACGELVDLDLSLEALQAGAVWDRSDLELLPLGVLTILLSKRHGAVWELDPPEVEAWEAMAKEDRWGLAECDEAQNTLCFELFGVGATSLRWSRGLPIAEVTVGGGAR